jgi:hypothetical protein
MSQKVNNHYNCGTKCMIEKAPKINLQWWLWVMAFAWTGFVVLGGHAQGTAFTYQGSLNDGGALANGNYDFVFTLYNDAENSNEVASPETNLDVPVANGFFTTTLDFSSPPWNGQPIWLQIQVRTNGSSPFVLLTPRQPVTSTPYAIQSLNAAAATVANSANSVAASNVSGTLLNSSLPSNAVFSGTITANSFAGNAADLTNVNASQLTGTVPLAALSPNLQMLATNNFWPPWQPSTAYLQGNTVMTPDLNLWEAWQGGMSGTIAPSGFESVTDKVVIWFPYGTAYGIQAPPNSLSIYTSYQNQVFPSTGYLQYFPYNSAAGSTNYLWGVNYFNIEGGFPFEAQGFFIDSLEVASAPVAPYNASLPTLTNFSILASWQRRPKISFMSDAPLIGIGPESPLAFNGNLGNIAVDDVIVSPQSWSYPPLNGTNQGFLMLDFHGIRSPRKISFYPSEAGIFPGVMVDHSSHVWAVPANCTIYVEGCSYEGGGHSAPYCLGNLWPEILARKLHCDNLIDGGVGGTGFTNFAGQYIYQMPESNAVADNYCGRASIIVSNNPDLVIVSGVGNDVSRDAGTSNSIYLSNLVWLTIVRAGLPNVPIVEMALLPNPQVNLPQFVAMMQAMSNAVFTFGDTNVYFINALPWFNGTGNVGATNGSGNTDFYTSNDGIHPTDYGAEYIASQVYSQLQRFGVIPVHAHF